MISLIPRYRILQDARFGAWFSKERRVKARLLEDYHFRAFGKTWTIPAGYEWDGASIPPCLWGFPFYYMPWGTYTHAALVHDFFCDLGEGGSEWLRGALWDQYPHDIPASKDVHFDFYLRCLTLGTSRSRARTMLFFVNLLGPRW